MTRIYLSYGMEYADPIAGIKRAAYLRSKLYELGYEVYNPYTDQDEMKASIGIHSSEDLINLKYSDLDLFIKKMTHIRKADIAELHHSDAIICFMDKATRGGAVGEVTVASLLDIPVYSIINKDDIKEISGWTLSCGNNIFFDVDSCIEDIRNNPII